MRATYYKMLRELLQRRIALFHYKVRQMLLQCEAIIIT